MSAPPKSPSPAALALQQQAAQRPAPTRDMFGGRMIGGLGMPTQKAKDFKGTLVRLVAYLDPHRGALVVIVLTGAMVPYAFGSSDGLFNLGSALSFAQVLPSGVYVAMNGRHFPWDRVRKNKEAGVFEGEP